MRKVWKWVIGIAIVLVVITALVVGAFLLRGRFANVAGVVRPGVQGPYGYRHNFPGMGPFGRGDGNWYGMPMRGPGMMRFGHFPFGGFLVGLFCLGVLALIVLGVILLVRASRKPTARSAAVAPVVAPVATTAEPAAPVNEPVAEVATHPCPNCGEPVQESWKHCPNCGTALT